MPKIDVDDEVFAWLQERATAFVDTPNTVLRRELMSHDDIAPRAVDVSNGDRHRRSGELITLISRGLIQPGDALVFGKRNGETYRGTVTENGEIQVQGRPYGSPSGALKACLGYDVNGWTNWIHENSGKTLDAFRQ